MAWRRRVGRQTRSRTYDDSGNVKTLIDRDGHAREFEYDAWNRQTHEHWLQNTTVIRDIAWSFDNKGRLTSPSDPDATYSFLYDDMDRVKSVDNLGTLGAARVVLSVGYDADGNRTAANANAGYHTIADNRMDADGTYAYLKRRC